MARNNVLLVIHYFIVMDSRRRGVQAIGARDLRNQVSSALAAAAIAAWPVGARAIAAWPVDARAIAAWPVVDARSVMNWPAPTVPSYWAAPAETAMPAIAAPIPARPAPSGLVPAIAPPSPNELNGLHGSKFIRCRPQGDRVNHGSMRASADHCTHDRERRGQCQAEFAHCIFPLRLFRWVGSTATSVLARGGPS